MSTRAIARVTITPHMRMHPACPLLSILITPPSTIPAARWSIPMAMSFTKPIHAKQAISLLLPLWLQIPQLRELPLRLPLLLPLWQIQSSGSTVMRILQIIVAALFSLILVVRSVFVNKKMIHHPTLPKYFCPTET